MESNSYQRLLFVFFFSLVISNPANSIRAQGFSAQPSLPPDTPPNLQPSASLGAETEISPFPSLPTSAEYISIPPSTNSPSESPGPTPFLSPDASPNSLPSSSPGPQPKILPTPSAAPSAEFISNPPSTDPPSDSPPPTPSLSPGNPPNLQPAASPGPRADISTSPEMAPSPWTQSDLSPTPTLAPSTDHFAIPPNTVSSPDATPPITDPPSDSSPPIRSDADPASNAGPPSNADAPSESMPPSSDIDPTVKKICDSTDYPSLCLSTVIPLLKGHNNIAFVLEVAMNASADLTNLGMLMAQKLADAPDTTPDVVTILHDCTDMYDNAMYNFQNALEALFDHNVGTMNSMLSAVITDVGDCEDEFKGMDSPLATYADKVTKMTSNCLAIVSLLQ